jgi:hypothetical protein
LSCNQAQNGKQGVVTHNLEGDVVFGKVAPRHQGNSEESQQCTAAEHLFKLLKTMKMASLN